MNRDTGEGLPEAGRAIAEALIERGAEPDVFTAAALNDEAQLRTILQTDPTLIHERLRDGRTAVNLAVLAGSNATLSVLLQAGADPQNDNALSRAARMDDTDACKLLIEHGAEINDKAVLAAAWRNQDPACLELMLTNGGNPNANNGHRGAIHWVSASNPAAVQPLINAGADVNARAPAATNNTALHHAAANADSTARLLAVGADPTLCNDNKESPPDIADRIGAQDVADLLRAALEGYSLARLPRKRLILVVERTIRIEIDQPIALVALL
ncbi:MAG: ankyrin repeat protein [Candidatus Latescibacterota bacterium]|jgi:ankyrin repeat protein